MTALTLFDLGALVDDDCQMCGTSPARVRCTRAANLLTALDTTRPAGPRSAMTCWYCAHRYADVHWRRINVACPRGGCPLWRHTWQNRDPATNCRRHHHETTVVRLDPIEAP